DCLTLYVGCGLASEDGCTGGVYVNNSTDQTALNALSQALTACKGNCALCDRLSLPPACISGLCQRSPL
ncbi:MAG TPA: hypothetical protein VI072_06930, partial [Polyangiaceae bacterium]